MESPPIVFFDGVCGLCNGFVDWCVKLDRDAKLKFAPLQGSTASKTLSDTDRENLQTIVLLKGDVVYRRSEAVLQILSTLGGPLRVLAILLRIFPRVLRDSIYDRVARERYHVWGKREFCRVPSREERARFLD